ncbi:hypothetical protein ACT691_05940 [Vibrio metschnikovii]
MLDELEAETVVLTSSLLRWVVGFDKIEKVDYGQAIQYMDYIFAMTDFMVVGITSWSSNGTVLR